MKLLITSTALLAFLALVILTIGYLLPATRTGRAERIFSASAEAIVAAITDVERQTEWRTDVRSIEMDGGSWIETNSAGERIRFAWTEQSADRLALRFSSDLGYSGEWRAYLAPAPGGTKLSVEEQATITSPVGRLLARLFFDPAGFSNRYLDALEARLESLE
jgi:hypothetical protein